MGIWRHFCRRLPVRFRENWRRLLWSFFLAMCFFGCLVVVWWWFGGGLAGLRAVSFLVAGIVCGSFVRARNIFLYFSERTIKKGKKKRRKIKERKKKGRKQKERKKKKRSRKKKDGRRKKKDERRKKKAQRGKKKEERSQKTQVFHLRREWSAGTS